MTRILVVRLKAIGDLLLSTAFLRALRKARPQAEIHLLTTRSCEPVVRHSPRIDRVLLHPEPGASWGERLRFFRDLRSARYGQVFDLGATPRSAWITLATGAPERIGFDFRIRKWAFTCPVPRNRVRKFQSLVVMDLLKPLGIPGDGDATELFLGPEEEEWARRYFGSPPVSELGRRIGINPTGTWPSKRWPEGLWRETAVLIHGKMGVKPILFGGPDDDALLASVREGIEDKTLVKPSTTLLEAAAFIAGLDVLLGSDGTPQHLAQALGTPSLTLWGPGWGLGWTKPSDPRHRYLQNFLDCGPCDRTRCPYPEEAGRAPHTRRECLTRWSPSAVVEALQRLLDATSGRRRMSSRAVEQ